MRLGIVLVERQEAAMARIAEEHGLFGVLAGAGNPLTATTAAVYASTSTDFVRVAVRLQLGLEHPITIAEELAILDNVNNGRTVVLVDTGELDTADAADEIAVLREALGSRPIQHEGRRWKVPAGLPANVTAPPSIAVTPKPVQLEIPFWVTGPRASEVGPASGLAILATTPRQASTTFAIQPGLAPIHGDLKTDRDVVSAWAAAGASHLFLELPPDGDAAAVMTLISRYLVPEVGMPHFPRVMSDSRVPLPWPGDGPID